LEEVYEQFTPMLLSAVSHLARRGYAINPGEALDLIHDFYLEVLPKLRQNFDASKGAFSTYLYGAFLRYARPRIIRDSRARKMLMTLDESLLPRSTAFEAVFEELAGDDLDVRIAEACKSLPRDLRLVLDRKLTKNESEREIARGLRLSRREVRQRLAEALGRVAIALDQDDLVADSMRPLAVRLWRDQQSLMQVAADLGLSRREARQRYARLLVSLGSAVTSLG
jgi:RNA polymerase sigma factor (sigma-70 family)